MYVQGRNLREDGLLPIYFPKVQSGLPGLDLDFHTRLHYARATEQEVV